MTGAKTNEVDGTRAVLRNTRTSAYKIREVLDLVRDLPVGEALDILRFSERDCAALVLKLLNSAIANAENNDHLVPDELYIAACFADEGRTYKTFRPRARGRAGKLRKRTAHITIIVSRLPERRLGIVKAKQERAEVDRRSRRVAASQKQGGRLRRTRRGRDEEGSGDQDAIDKSGERDQVEDVEQVDTTGATGATDVGGHDEQDHAKDAAVGETGRHDDAEPAEQAAKAEDEEK